MGKYIDTKAMPSIEANDALAHIRSKLMYTNIINSNFRNHAAFK